MEIIFVWLSAISSDEKASNRFIISSNGSQFSLKTEDSSKLRSKSPDFFESRLTLRFIQVLKMKLAKSRLAE